MPALRFEKTMSNPVTDVWEPVSQVIPEGTTYATDEQESNGSMYIWLEQERTALTVIILVAAICVLMIIFVFKYRQRLLKKRARKTEGKLRHDSHDSNGKYSDVQESDNMLAFSFSGGPVYGTNHKLGSENYQAPPAYRKIETIVSTEDDTTVVKMLKSTAYDVENCSNIEEVVVDVSTEPQTGNRETDFKSIPSTFNSTKINMKIENEKLKTDENEKSCNENKHNQDENNQNERNPDVQEFGNTLAFSNSGGPVYEINHKLGSENYQAPPAYRKLETIVSTEDDTTVIKIFKRTGSDVGNCRPREGIRKAFRTLDGSYNRDKAHRFMAGLEKKDLVQDLKIVPFVENLEQRLVGLNYLDISLRQGNRFGNLMNSTKLNYHDDIKNSKGEGEEVVDFSTEPQTKNRETDFKSISSTFHSTKTNMKNENLNSDENENSCNQSKHNQDENNQNEINPDARSTSSENELNGIEQDGHHQNPISYERNKTVVLPENDKINKNISFTSLSAITCKHTKVDNVNIQVGPDTRETNQFSQLASNILNAKVSCLSERNNFKEFNYEGGKWSVPNSDINLIVPKGAVPKNIQYGISRKVRTDLSLLKRYLKADEYFIAPVAQFHCDKKFQKHVQIEIPHCLRSISEEENIRVQFGDTTKDIPFREIPKLPKENNIKPYVYYTVGPQYVVVHTTHFTEFLCSQSHGITGSTSKHDLQLEGIVFVRYSNNGDQEVQIKVYTLDALHQILDMRENLINQQKAQNFHLYQTYCMQVPASLSGDDEVSTILEPQDNWSPVCGTDGKPFLQLKQSRLIKDMIFCQEKKYNPTTVADYVLAFSNTKKATYFKGFMQLKIIHTKKTEKNKKWYQKAEKLIEENEPKTMEFETKMRINFSVPFELSEQSVSVCFKDLSDVFDFMSKNLPQQYIIPLARRLGFNTAEWEDIQESNPRLLREQKYQLLERYQQKSGENFSLQMILNFLEEEKLYKMSETIKNNALFTIQIEKDNHEEQDNTTLLKLLE